VKNALALRAGKAIAKCETGDMPGPASLLDGHSIPAHNKGVIDLGFPIGLHDN
jgi:hypothetical protein